MFATIALTLSLMAPPALLPQDPDNTRKNKEGGTTAQQQKENPADRKMSQDVRKALMADKTLSTYAHNVKIVTTDGMVTLKGPVRSDDEKAAIEAKAAEIAGGKDKIKSEIEVAPPKK
jgi:hyperosmotically inducible protein